LHSPIFAGKAGAYQNKPHMGPHSNGRFLALPANRRGRKLIGVANTLAYYDAATIKALKRFIVLALIY
jgi:hypothetical protein